ncbi:MAG: ABC transporter ATP-binding protein [Pseudomonadota bacterium]
MTSVSRLKAENITVRYSQVNVLDRMHVEIPDRAFTVIIGPNGSGKSTLIRALSRLLKPNAGQILLDETPLQKQKNRAIAQKLAVLPQGLSAPETITVSELVSRGRTPYQTPLKQWSKDDHKLVEDALAKTGLLQFSDRPVLELSGGQQQRVWIAMVLAQDTDILLLDEPTTFLDLQHQIELLTLIRKLSAEFSKTVVAVLHDINLAARFADHIVAMKNGNVHTSGDPASVITKETIKSVFGLESEVISDPIHGKPYIIPA